MDIEKLKKNNMAKKTTKKTKSSAGSFPAKPFKDKEFSIHFLTEMIRARILEERLIHMVKKGEGHFWIGGPGEEAFAVAMGMQIDKGEGVEHDFLHFHYRSNGIISTMGEPPINFLRQMHSTALDPYSAGRNFASHVAKKEWNIVPITSTIETQFSVAPGTARAQMRAMKNKQKSGITIVIGGDAGTAEADFATAMIWASRPNEELPLLMIVTNNKWGISTAHDTQHGEDKIADRATSFGIKSKQINAQSAENAWSGIKEAMEYVRETGKPYVLEAMVSRMYGHSSSSGANRVSGELCPIEILKKDVLKNKWLTEKEFQSIWDRTYEEITADYETIKKEPKPDPKTVYDHTYANGENARLPGGKEEL